MDEWIKDVEKNASNPENIVDNQRVLKLIDYIQSFEELIRKKDDALKECRAMAEAIKTDEELELQDYARHKLHVIDDALSLTPESISRKMEDEK